MSNTRRNSYPTGWVTLAGIVIGALAGGAWYELPVGMAAGLALGVGIDSLLNHWFNEIPAAREGN